MSFAAKYLDLVVGVDTHIVLLPTPAGPVPTPVPHPFVGLLFDPEGYLAGAAKVLINGLPAARAGTKGHGMPPHVPLGGPFLKPPTNEAELFMGSSTVLVGGEPMGYAGLPVLTCQDIGLPAPRRSRRKSTTKSLMLPTSLVLPIPAGNAVLVGGFPVVSLNSIDAPLPSAKKRLDGKVQKARATKPVAPAPRQTRRP